MVPCESQRIGLADCQSYLTFFLCFPECLVGYYVELDYLKNEYHVK